MSDTATKLTYLNTTKTLIKDNLNLGGANISTEPFRAYSSKLKGIYKDFLANGTDTLWNNWEKVIGEGTQLSLTPTIKGKMKVDLKGNTQQNGTPTPDTPIPVQVVSGDNTIKVANGDNTEYEEYPISLGNIELCKTTTGTYQDKIAKSTGKNLFENIVYKDNYIVGSDGTETYSDLGCIWKKIKVKPNTTYTLSYLSTDYTFAQRISEYNSNNVFIQRLVTNSSPYTFTTGANTEYINVSGLKTDTNIMIEEGNITTPVYEPYGTSWYLNKQIGKVVLNGSETVDTPNTVSYSFNKSTYLPNCNLPSGNTTNYLVNYFSISGVEISTIGKCWVGNSYINFNFDNTNANVNTFKTWLSTHNTIVYYVLATPTYEEITDTTLLSQLEALAYSYEGTTNISQVNDDMPFVLDITALKEMS